MKLVAVVLAALRPLTIGGGVKVTLPAPIHTPKINIHWPYTV